VLCAVAAGTLLVYQLKSVAPVVSLGVVYLPLTSIIAGGSALGRSRSLRVTQIEGIRQL
jgi:hypothetical protein